jgi:hypothetical protein
MNAQLQGGRSAPRPLRIASCVAMAAALLLGGCFAYPDSSERVNDDIVYSQGAKDTDFGAFKTFAIDPSVHLAIIQADGTVESDTLDQEAADELVAQTVSNMEDRGYTQVAREETPELGITLTAISGLAIGVVSGGYYWGYYGYYWGYPGWGYYYPYQVAYAYRTGTLVIDLVDLKSTGGVPPANDGGPPRPGALPVVWTAAAYKAAADIEEPSSAGVRLAQQAIDQAFNQSPYLRSSN